MLKLNLKEYSHGAFIFPEESQPYQIYYFLTSVDFVQNFARATFFSSHELMKIFSKNKRQKQTKKC